MNDSTQSSPRRRRKSSRGRNIAIAAVVVLAGATWYGVHLYRANASKEGEYQFSTVRIGDVEDLVTATGILEPRNYVDVGAQVSGQIEKLYVEVGDVVKAGDLLASIDATTSQARVDSNKAQMESSRTSLLTQIANLEKAQRDFERQDNLLKEDATTKETWLNSKTTLENAQRSVESSKLSIAQQEANMRIEANNLKYTSIRAPIDGTVMSIAVKQGQTINASQSAPTVMRLANLNTMTVRTDVSEADVAKLWVGMDVYFTTLGAGQNRRWYSTLKRIEPTPKTQNSVVLFPVLFDVENEGDSLRSNLTTQVFFVVAESRNVLTVPMAALQQGQQIARELAAKRREEEQKVAADAPAAAAPGAAAPGAGGRDGAPSGPAAGAPGNGENQFAARSGGPGGQGGPGSRGPGGPEGRSGGGGFGGRNGGQGMQNLTPEQREEMLARFQRGGGGGPGAGGFGGMGAGGARGTQQRRGTVMVKLADGSLEPRQVVVGVSDRVHGQVIEGLTEGEEVVVGKVEAEPATPSASQQQTQQNFDPRRGGGNFGGGGGRPF